MLILRLKQAETALADGRLDEAFEIAQSQEVKAHRRGQQLITKLARAYARRAQENLEAERIDLALTDCNKAEKLAGNASDVGRLRSAICEAIEQRRLGHQDRSLKVEQAREHIKDGWLSVGEQILKDAGDNSRAKLLMQEAAAARMQLNEAVAKAEQALKRDDLDGAIGLVRKADIGQNHNGTAAELVSRLRFAAAAKIRQHVEQGRIDLAKVLYEKVSPIGAQSSELSELGLALGQCRQAAVQLTDGEPRSAVALLKKAKVICPSAKWLTTAIEQAKQAAEHLEELLSGPLGLDAAATAATAENDAEDEHNLAPAEKRKRMMTSSCDRHYNDTGGATPSRFVLQIDGVGSFLVVRDKSVAIGPASSSARPMVGLLADPYLPVATIERTDDDYFIRSSSPVEVEGTKTTERLLADGNRIALSDRCRMKFGLPNPASTTAVLTLTSARLSRSDIRQVILMNRDILIGPTLSSHIHTDWLNEAVTLYVQNGQMRCKAKDNIIVDGGPIESNVGLPVNKQIRIGQLSLVITTNV